MTTSREIQAHSGRTGKTYRNWDALVAAEANGWLAVAVITSPGRSWPYVVGPFATKHDARKARRRLHRALLREQMLEPYKREYQFQCFVRPAWKEAP